ncbi:hypothetical protein F3Y30_16420 [Sinorhizobium sp. BG8]|nr:hypothetical protein F3Y30_16420 [Sinorhizobium sp. BG8]
MAAATSFAAPSQAARIYIGYGGGGHHHHHHHPRHHHHGGYIQIYDSYSSCLWKKVRRYDAWGNLVIKRVRICA